MLNLNFQAHLSGMIRTQHKSLLRQKQWSAMVKWVVKDNWAYLRLFFLHFFHSSFHLIFILLRSYLVAFPYFLFLFRSPMIKWAVKDNGVYLRLLASLCNLCNPLCAVIKEWWHWWRFWNNWNKYILYLLLWKFYFQNRSDLENESEIDAFSISIHCHLIPNTPLPIMQRHQWQLIIGIATWPSTLDRVRLKMPRKV